MDVTGESRKTSPTAWGARLIAPADLLYDRQDLVAESDEAKTELVAWLNGGAIHEALDWLRENYWQFRQDDAELVIYNDADGMIVGSTQGSGGYVYLAGWLKPDRHEARTRPRRCASCGARPSPVGCTTR